MNTDIKALWVKIFTAVTWIDLIQVTMVIMLRSFEVFEIANDIETLLIASNISRMHYIAYI